MGCTNHNYLFIAIIIVLPWFVNAKYSLTGTPQLTFKPLLEYGEMGRRDQFIFIGLFARVRLKNPYYQDNKIRFFDYSIFLYSATDLFNHSFIWWSRNYYRQ